MIVACERCRTRFQLDDTRVPGGGVRVRCSRCKHAFFVMRPGASKDDLIRATASQAAQQPTFAPGPTHDLSVALPQDGDLSSATHQFGERITPKRGARSSDSDGSPASAAREGEDESDWQFNDERPAPGTQDDRSASARGRQSERTRGGRGEVPISLDELGNPESWDFFAANEARNEVEPELAAGETAAGAGAAPAEPSAQGAAARKPRQASVRPVPVSRGAEVAAAPLSRLARLAGGALSALLLVALSALSLAPGSAPRVELPSSQKVGELALEELRGRLLENAVAGRLFVVSGRLRNPGLEPVSLGATVRVTLLRDQGQELMTAPALAGLAPSEAFVREESPERLQERLAASAAALAWTPLPPGESVAVTAVVENVPLEAQSFALTVQPAEPPPPPPAVVPVPEPVPAPPPPPAPSARKARHLQR
ncbi:MAG TPA: zinc-ribbon domain-containing protein [Myxococcota bacterium]|nr:zinc-ribbon domain-containing protein [Myxococcota bacterium]